MSIDFNTIPAGGDLRVPFAYIEFDNSQAQGGLPSDQYTVLMIGQRLAGGSVAANVPTPIQSGAQAAGYFGNGSMLATMCDWFKSVNSTTPLVAIAMDDAVAGIAATGKLAVTGPATGAGTLQLYIAGIRVQVAVAAGDAAAAIATNIVAAINAVAGNAINPRNQLPITAVVNAVTTTEVDLTARHKGECGNDIDLRVNYYTGDVTPAGVAIAITAMAGGTSNPDISTVIAALGDVWYQAWGYPYTDAANQLVLETELTSRFGGIRQIDGVAYNAYRGTATATDTYGATRNSPLVTTMGTGIAPEPPYVWAAVNVAAAAPALSADPARPLQTLQLTGLKPPAQADLFQFDERNLHLHSGIATYKVDAGGNVLIERQVTNYQKNANNIADTSYLDVETIATLSYLRYSTRSWITNKYPRHKLAGDTVTPAPGQAIVTPKVINGELMSLAQDWVTAGLIEDLADYKAALVCQINANDPNRLDVLAVPNLVNQFRIFAEQIQFIL